MARMFYMAVLGLFLIGLTASADSITLALTPGPGTVSGLPGSTVGWGYSIDNDSSDYLLVANSYFCAGTENPLFTTCAPSLGASTYNDFIANNSTLIAPDTTGVESFDAGTNSGVGEYIIDSAATAGETDIGSLVVVYDLFSGDPFTDPSATQIGGDMDLTAAAEVEVTGPTSAVPEPGTPFFLGLGLAALIAFDAVSKFRVRLKSRSPAASRWSI
jgi:hypothetical protein